VNDGLKNLNDVLDRFNAIPECGGRTNILRQHRSPQKYMQAFKNRSSRSHARSIAKITNNIIS